MICIAHISLGDVGVENCANSVGFWGSLPLLPHLCPLSVPEVGVCGVYSESPHKGLFGTPRFACYTDDMFAKGGRNTLHQFRTIHVTQTGTRDSKKKIAAGAIVSTPGIGPTPSGTNPPCTSIMLRYRCGRITETQTTTLQWKTPSLAFVACSVGIRRAAAPHELAGAVASTVCDGPRRRSTLWGRAPVPKDFDHGCLNIITCIDPEHSSQCLAVSLIRLGEPSA